MALNNKPNDRNGIAGDDGVNRTDSPSPSSPDDDLSTLQAAMRAIEAGDVDAAATALLRLYTTSTKSRLRPVAAAVLGKLYRHVGQWDDAERALQTARAMFSRDGLDDESADCARSLGGLYLATGR